MEQLSKRWIILHRKIDLILSIEIIKNWRCQNFNLQIGKCRSIYKLKNSLFLLTIKIFNLTFYSQIVNQTYEYMTMKIWLNNGEQMWSSPFSKYCWKAEINTTSSDSSLISSSFDLSQNELYFWNHENFNTRENKL